MAEPPIGQSDTSDRPATKQDRRRFVPSLHTDFRRPLRIRGPAPITGATAFGLVLTLLKG